MPLRKAYAAALQQLRLGLGRFQYEVVGKLGQSQVSRLESGKHSATVGTSADIAEALGIKPLSFFALVFAAAEKQSARQVLLEALAELEELGLADELLPSEPMQIPQPEQSEAEKRWAAVQAHKEAGATQKETAALLGISTSAVGRLWHKTYE